MDISTPFGAASPQNDVTGPQTPTALVGTSAQKEARLKALRRMDLDCALSIARDCRDEATDPTIEVTEEAAKRAAVALLEEVTTSEGKLRRMHAALQRLEDGRPRHTGEQLCLRQDGGGWRHFLDGDPVHAGNTLLLLTTDGWLTIRYEWCFDPNRSPTAYVYLPGAFGDDDVPMRLPETARLAWPCRR